MMRFGNIIPGEILGKGVRIFSFLSIIAAGGIYIRRN